MNDLYLHNHPAQFWKLLEQDGRVVHEVPQSTWTTAALQLQHRLPGELASRSYDDVNAIYADILGETLFGPRRYDLSRLKRFYYTYARAMLPARSRHIIRQLRQSSVEQDALLGWPVEDSFVDFHFRLLARVIETAKLSPVRMIGLWPDTRRFAFVLTHDVEARAGHDFVHRLMELEEKYGFRSSFNFVPEGYAVDDVLLEEIRARGFEVGVHGLRHDGRLFLSEAEFMRRAHRINEYVKDWKASGYRSPMTHRQPEWMQSLDIAYDLSFFDTDPYEPMAGGTMSIWPFFIGNFLELPYTLMQDHTYFEVFKHDSPNAWLDKVEFIRQHNGMVLLNAHPDYLMKTQHLRVYEEFLAAMSQYTDMWHALPNVLASWWRARADLGNMALEDIRDLEVGHNVCTWTASSEDGQLYLDTSPAQSSWSLSSGI